MSKQLSTLPELKKFMDKKLSGNNFPQIIIIIIINLKKKKFNNNII
jgi:hypothetical protein